MHLFWERTGTDNNLNVETTAAATLQGDGTVLVTVTAADAEFCGVADVTLHYGWSALTAWTTRLTGSSCM